MGEEWSYKPKAFSCVGLLGGSAKFYVHTKQQTFLIFPNTCTHSTVTPMNNSTTSRKIRIKMHVSVRSEDKDKWTKNNRESIINKHLLRNIKISEKEKT